MGRLREIGGGGGRSGECEGEEGGYVELHKIHNPSDSSERVNRAKCESVRFSALSIPPIALKIGKCPKRILVLIQGIITSRRHSTSHQETKAAQASPQSITADHTPEHKRNLMLPLSFCFLI
jgi:hypothetical protein